MTEMGLPCTAESMRWDGAFEDENSSATSDLSRLVVGEQEEIRLGPEPVILPKFQSSPFHPGIIVRPINGQPVIGLPRATTQSSPSLHLLTVINTPAGRHRRPADFV